MVKIIAWTMWLSALRMNMVQMFAHTGVSKDRKSTWERWRERASVVLCAVGHYGVDWLCNIACSHIGLYSFFQKQRGGSRCCICLGMVSMRMLVAMLMHWRTSPRIRKQMNMFLSWWNRMYPLSCCVAGSHCRSGVASCRCCVTTVRRAALRWHHLWVLCDLNHDCVEVS